MSVFLDSNWLQRAPSFPPLSCWMRYPLGRSGLYLAIFAYCCWCHAESERTGCMFLLLYFCLLLRRACSGCILYIPACLFVEAYMLLAGAGQMDGWTYRPPPPRDTRRRRQEGDENGDEMHNTYLPTYLPVRLVCLLSGPCTLLDIHPSAALRQPTRYTTATVYSNKLRDDIVRVSSRQSPDRDPRRHGMHKMR